MAFNFFGTYTSGQWNEFAAFVAIQRVDLQARLDWLNAQLDRIGNFDCEYDSDTNFPTPHDNQTGDGGFTCIPDSSYGAKLLTAYRMLGGVPETDMLLRTRDQPIFLTQGTTTQTGDGSEKTGYSDIYSNGRRDRGGMRFDRDLGLRVEAVKKPFLETIKHKRERLEFKIKRCLDWSHQILDEIDAINALIAKDTTGNLDDLLARVSIQASTPGSFGVITDDNDVFGLGIGRVNDLTEDDSTDEAGADEERVPK